MGHSVNSVGYRLRYSKNWKYGAVARSSQEAVSFYFLYHFLELVVDKFFNSNFELAFFYSHFFFFQNGFNDLVLTIFVYNHMFQRLLDFFFLKKSSFRIFFDHFGLGASSVLFKSAAYSLNTLYLLFLKNHFVFLVANIFQIYLRKIAICAGVPALSTIIVKFVLIDRPVLNAALFCRFIIFKLKRKYSLGKIINSFLNFNFSNFCKNNVLGVFVRGAGRFTRTQRASLLAVQKGVVPFSTVGTLIDFFNLSVSLKYGSCSIKVWVSYKK
jgi:hypothetical protein